MIRRRQPGTGRAAAPQTLLAMLKLARPNLPLANHNAKIVQFFSSLLAAQIGRMIPMRPGARSAAIMDVAGRKTPDEGTPSFGSSR
jgi:hypothetical protein